MIARAKNKRKAKRYEQKWSVGDIFSIPLQNNMYAFGQVLEKMGNYEVFCVLFDGMHEEEASVNEAVCPKNIKVILTIESYELDKHVYPVVEHRVPVIPFPDTEKYDELRYPSHYSSILRDLAEAFHNIRNWKHYYDEALEYQYLFSKYYSESSNG
ncbi:Imm26 family immunity protein [Bacillus sp. NPDC077411]|uniref:Imm26 family immunity protein n=1 Tax=Bacillus sp. NPDC077411 TaxID=3363947 RepID=UPI0037C878A8